MSLAAVITAYPCGTSSPEPFHTAASKPTGYHMACHGVARQGEDGRTHFVRQVRHKRHTHATRIPPLPSSCPALPCGKSARCTTPATTLHPSQTRQRHANPRGIQRRPHLVRQVRQVRQVRHKRRATATRIPPQPSKKHTYSTGRRALAALIPSQAAEMIPPEAPAPSPERIKL